MTSTRKKWDLSGLAFTNFFSPASNVSSESDTSFVDPEHGDGNMNVDNNYSKSPGRSPLTEINQNLNESPRCILPLEKLKSQKTNSCPAKQFHSTKKTPISYHYDLRKTPDRRSRLAMNFVEDNDNEEFTDACDSPIYVLRNHPVYPKRTSESKQVSFTENSSENRRETYLVTNSALKNKEQFFSVKNSSDFSFEDDHKMQSYVTNKSDESEIFQTPCGQGSSKDSIRGKGNFNFNSISFSLNETVESQDKTMNDYTFDRKKITFDDTLEINENERRGSYVVLSSTFNRSDLPETPALRRSPRFIDNSSHISETSDNTTVFEVHYTQNKSKLNKQGKNVLNAKPNLSRRKTVCQPFHLITDERYPKTNNVDLKDISFTSSLRQNNVPKVLAKSNGTTTKTSPFNLTQSRKRPHDNDEEYKSLAERVADHFKTPKRFRSSSRLTVFKPPAKKASPVFIRPKTPKLAAVKRRRQTSVMSYDEKMNLEVQEMKKYQFRARAFNPAIKNHPFVPKTERKSFTIPKPIQLATERRVSERKSSSQSFTETTYEFHARKVPKSVLEGPKVLRERNSVEPTLPVSPKFALKNREVKWKSFTPLNTIHEVFQFKARPAPSNKPPTIVSAKKPLTQPKPFSFYEKDKERFSKKEQKIEEEIKEQLKSFEFHAQEIPASVLKPTSTPHIEKKPATVPRPFNLRTSRKFSCHDFDEVLKVPNKTRFKAKPASVLKKPPFVPNKSLLPPIECLDFQLHTEERAIERKHIKEQRQSAEKEREIAAQLYRKEQELREKEAIRELRKNLVHKAQPVPNYKHLEIRASNKRLTEPQSPNLLTKRRTSSITG